MKQQLLGDRIAQARREKAVRDQRDVTQQDVAKGIGVSGAAVSQWESGKRIPREEDVAKVAAFLGVTPAFLRYGLEPKAAPAPVEHEGVIYQNHRVVPEAELDQADRVAEGAAIVKKAIAKKKAAKKKRRPA